MDAWRERARTAEGLGYSALYLTDHLDAQFGRLVAATVAAEVTTTLHVGTLVLNNDLRNPVVLAKEIATLGLAAPGRIEVGLGGWLRSDYDETGVSYENPRTRVERLAESLQIQREQWGSGESTFDGRPYSVNRAQCEPRPDALPRVIVGGGSKGVLTVASLEADIVGINTSLSSGEKGGDISSAAALDHFDQCLDWVREAAGDRFSSLEIQITTFAVSVVPSSRAAARSATMLGFPGENALDLPILLIGTEVELCDRLLERRERWSFSNIVVPSEAMEVFAPMVARMNGH